jgi:nucleotide-binding universal stress UspA family protein
MFKHLLIPLDGSRLAESALVPAVYLAQTLNAAVTLLHIIEQDAPRQVHHEPHLTGPVEAQQYLDAVAGRTFPPGLSVRRHVHTIHVSDVARSIAGHADELGPDLIVMCAHGRSGPRNWLVGSIAQQVIGLATTPVLLVRSPEGAAPPPFNCRRLLVPLDGDPAHESVLPIAAALGGLCGSTLHLVMVIPTMDTLSGEEAAAAKLLPHAMNALLEINQQNADEYLRGHLPPLQAAGLTATTEVVRGDPAAGIVETAKRAAADLIVLGTHRKAGLGAFWAGSVAPKVSGRTKIPLLLIPLPKEKTGD